MFNRTFQAATSQDSFCFHELTEKKWTPQQQVKLGGLPQSLRVINGQLWACCLDVGIVVLDSELQQQRVIQRDDFVYDTTALPNGDVIMAADTGLYHTNSTGEGKECTFLSNGLKKSEQTYVSHENAR